jgi:hypothetical protein
MRSMRRVLLDTDVVVAARRSPGGAAAELLRCVHAGLLDMLASATLFAEYEAVLLRPEHLLASWQSAHAMNRTLDELAERVVRVHCWFQPRFGRRPLSSASKYLPGRKIPAMTGFTSRVKALHTRSSCPRPRWRRCESSPLHRPWLRFAPCHRGR